MTKVEFRDVSFGYGERPILKHIDLTFDEPGLTCILGPNGVGKTTLVRLINKLLQPDSGQVLIDGMDVRTMNYLQIAKIVAFVSNSGSSTFSMTVPESIMLGRTPISGWSVTEKDMEAVEKAIQILELDDLVDRDVSELSAGQLQRVMIARGLVQEPKVLILDEPTSNLDVRYQMEVMKFLRGYAREQGIVIIMVCHDLNITAAYADRAILMHDGTVYADGTIQEVLTEKNLKTLYEIDTKIMEIDQITHVLQIPL